MKLFRRIKNKLSQRVKAGNNSVDDYKDEKALGMALEDVPTLQSAAESLGTIKSNEPVQWKLTNYDKRNSEPQTVKQEVQRLKVLQSYMILDSDREATFNRITDVCSAMFGTICLVSLVDLSRQWFLSKAGPVEMDELPRSISFCAHAVISKHRVFIVPDMTKDDRFRENPLVTGGPNVRFYAGAALVSPEGYKIGTLCLVSDTPREGFTEVEKGILTNLSAIVMDAIVSRRNRILKEESEKRIKEIGVTMAGTHRALQNTRTKLKPVVMTSAKTTKGRECLDDLEEQAQLCAATARTLLVTDNTAVDDLEDKYNAIVEPETDLRALYKNLVDVFQDHHANICLVLEGKNLPTNILCEELLLFRASMSLILQCLQAKSTDLTVTISSWEDQWVRVTCQGTAANAISLEAKAVQLVSALDGSHGSDDHSVWLQVPKDSNSHTTVIGEKLETKLSGSSSPP